ncbi:MAG: hypothetical protein PHQ81_10140 [Methanofollis sp.]|nr:hypothetical protein [Methanofollis sp.]
MQEITGVRKLANGVLVEYSQEGGRRTAGFTYQEIIDMRVNAFDLIENPDDYLIEPMARRIEARPDKCERHIVR